MANELETAVGVIRELIGVLDKHVPEDDVEGTEAMGRAVTFANSGGKRSGIFAELVPVLNDRTVVITISLEGANCFRVNVIPKQKVDDDEGTKKDKHDEPGVLTQAFTVVGSAVELDVELPALLTQFVAERKKAADAIALFRTRADGERKEVEDEAKKLGAAAEKKLTDAKKKKADADKKAGDKPAPKEEANLFGGGGDDEAEDKD